MVGISGCKINSQIQCNSSLKHTISFEKGLEVQNVPAYCGTQEFKGIQSGVYGFL
jgi:hypothetical protein